MAAEAAVCDTGFCSCARRRRVAAFRSAEAAAGGRGFILAALILTRSYRMGTFFRSYRAHPYRIINKFGSFNGIFIFQ